MTAPTAGSRIRRLIATLALFVPLSIPQAHAAPGPGAAPAAGATYTNPVSRSFADTFADPDIVRGKDGYWYAFGTTDPLRAGGDPHTLPVARSRNLVDWSYVTDALGGHNTPEWAAKDASYWAPDIDYHDGRYWLYFTVTQTDVTGEKDDSAIGVATAPTPAGPWKTHDKPVIPPRRAGEGKDGFLWTFDPMHITDHGRRYLYYGSYNGGLFVTALDAAGTATAGRPTRVATDNRFEGTHVVRRHGWWYLTASSGDCCAGPTTGYSLFTGRSRSPRGPFTDRDGIPLTASRTGGTPTLSPNGNRWVGTGHHTVITDTAGQDWIVYHAIDRHHPYLDKPYGINRRPMLLDRLDWPGGWPAVNHGHGASDTPQPAPRTTPTGNGGNSGHATPDTTGTGTRAGTGTGSGTRADADTDSGNDTGAGAGAGSGTDTSTGTDTGNGAGTGSGTGTGHGPADPVPGRLDPAHSDDFDDRPGPPDWHWIRRPAGHEKNGTYTWPTQNADLARDTNTASLMLQNIPHHTFTIETKLTINLGTHTLRNYQQAGLIAYTHDNRFIRLAHTAIWNTRQTEYAKEQPHAQKPAYGSMTIGPPATTTWLRLHHTTHHGEHHLKALTSTDGHHWTPGGTWTTPTTHPLHYGLHAMGGHGATAHFHYLHTYTP